MAGRVIQFHACRQTPPLGQPIRRDFIMTSGEDVRILLTVRDSDGDAEPLNLAGMAAYFRLSFSCAEEIMRDGTFLDFGDGTVALDLNAADTRDRYGRAWWRCNLGAPGNEAVIAQGAFNIIPASGYRVVNDAFLITPGGQMFDAYSGELSSPEGAFR